MLVERIDLRRPKGGRDVAVYVHWRLGGPVDDRAAGFDAQIMNITLTSTERKGVAK